MAKISSEFKRYVDKNISGLAESHLYAWKSRYEGKSKADVGFDLRVNHDNDSEVYTAEDQLNRKLTDAEREYFIDKFIKAVVSKHRR